MAGFVRPMLGEDHRDKPGGFWPCRSGCLPARPANSLVAWAHGAIALTYIMGASQLPGWAWRSCRLARSDRPLHHALDCRATPGWPRLSASVVPGWKRHLASKIAGPSSSARQIQRVVQRVGQNAQVCRSARPNPATATRPLCMSAPMAPVAMRPKELAGRAASNPTHGQNPPGLSRLRLHPASDGRNRHPVRDYESTSYVSSFKSIARVWPDATSEALRRGLGSAGQVVVLIDAPAV